MILTPVNDWRSWTAGYSMLPYVQAYPAETVRISDWAPLWRSSSRQAFVLESGKEGRYTIFGRNPVSLIQGKGRVGEVHDWPGEAAAKKESVAGEPLALISRWMKPYKAPAVKGAPEFCGGCVGFLGYDVVRFLEKLPEIAKDDLDIPDYVMMRLEEIWVLDHEKELLYCCVHVPNPSYKVDEAWIERQHRLAAEKAEAMRAEWASMVRSSREAGSAQRLARMKAVVEGGDLAIDPERLEGLERAFDKDAFMRAVEQIQEYIAAGDVFQVNLSVRQSKLLSTRPEDIYEWLRVLNPSPYMGFLRLDGFELVCASPELLVKVKDGQVRTRPIAGTRRRGTTAEEDRRMQDELLYNEKERAEHIMLVDLERNDLGRISRYGSVRVTELMAIERYSHVMHMVSEVTGELAEGRTGYDVIAAAFPGGTITGAPKVRTMEIIEELEPVRRGPYTGSMGWIGYNGNMELNIIIRTLLACGGKAYVQAGAGIVIDSIPEREYKESLNKAKALWKAVEYSERYTL